VVESDLARWLRDEEAAGSNPATPTQKRQVTGHLVACCSHYVFSNFLFRKPVGSEHGNGEPLGLRLTPAPSLLPLLPLPLLPVLR
jgi:hypothetical protein